MQQITKKALIELKNGQRSQGGAFLLPTAAPKFGLISERNGAVVRYGLVVFTGQFVPPDMIVEKVRHHISDTRTNETLRRLAVSFLEEIKRFKVGSIVQVSSSSTQFELVDFDG